MTTSTGTPNPAPPVGTARSGRSARERLLDAANEPFNAESVQTVGIDAVGVVLILLAVAAIGGAAAVTAVVAYLCIGLTLGALAKKEWK